MKIAIIGSRTYENTRKIKNLLTELRKKFAEDLVIISGGAKQGADFGTAYRSKPHILAKINDFKWLKETFDDAI